MKKGDIIMIFHDPITMQKQEGQAELLYKRGVCGTHEGHPLELWNVRFIDDDFLGLKLIYNTTITK
jgi:hypothetical protein